MAQFKTQKFTFFAPRTVIFTQKKESFSFLTENDSQFHLKNSRDSEFYRVHSTIEVNPATIWQTMPLWYYAMRP